MLRGQEIEGCAKKFIWFAWKRRDILVSVVERRVRCFVKIEDGMMCFFCWLNLLYSAIVFGVFPMTGKKDRQHRKNGNQEKI